MCVGWGLIVSKPENDTEGGAYWSLWYQGVERARCGPTLGMRSSGHFGMIYFLELAVHPFMLNPWKDRKRNILRNMKDRMKVYQSSYRSWVLRLIENGAASYRSHGLDWRCFLDDERFP